MALKWTHIMMHHSASHDAPGLDTEAIRRWHVEGRGWRDIGYHFVVEEIEGSYQVLAGRPLYLAGAHCPGWNAKAIGVCCVGNFESNRPSVEQLRAASSFVAGLCVALEIPQPHILAHRDHRATVCPGRFFDLEDFRRQVAERLE